MIDALPAEFDDSLATKDDVAQRIVRHLFEIVDGGRWSELGRVFREDIEYRRPGYQPLVGLARLRVFYESERIIASGCHSITSLVTQGRRAVCLGSFIGLGRDGSALSVEFADAYEIVSGRIARRTTYFFSPSV